MSTVPVSLGQLESHPWESANILRGPVDAADFKTYVFPPLFFADVVELPNVRSVIYRGFDFFVEIIPRKQRLCLLLNLDFAGCEDPSSKARDATVYASIIGATETGGVLYKLES